MSFFVYTITMENFIKEVLSNNAVFALSNGENYASIESQFEDDEEGLPIEVMCIWSSETATKELQKEEWAEYQIEQISLQDFLEDWCIGIFNDGLAFCLDVNEDDEPYEVQPLDLAYQIAKLISNNENKFPLKGYENIQEYIRTILPYVLEP